jgi:hypothetical protein
VNVLCRLFIWSGSWSSPTYTNPIVNASTTIDKTSSPISSSESNEALRLLRVSALFWAHMQCLHRAGSVACVFRFPCVWLGRCFAIVFASSPRWRSAVGTQPAACLPLNRGGATQESTHSAARLPPGRGSAGGHPTSSAACIPPAAAQGRREPERQRGSPSFPHGGTLREGA